MFFYEIHEGDEEVGTAVLLGHEQEFDPVDFFALVKKVRLLVKNLDATPEEFESHDLKREKVIPGKSEATIIIGPLKPGTYKFVGEFHESTAKGSIIAK